MPTSLTVKGHLAGLGHNGRRAAAVDAVSWARAHYKPRAVETRGQRRWAGWFAGYRPGPNRHQRAATGPAAVTRT